MNIGLLLTYNEADVIREVMDANRSAVDAIFALDGSDDGTAEILAEYPEVVKVFRDAEVAPRGVRDHHRQVLLDAARGRFGRGHWYTLMHGDEIFHDDPRAVIAAANRMRAQRVNWAVMQFFMHPGDPAPEQVPRVQDRLRWYSPFWVEIRQFRDRPRARYRPGEHGRVLPRGVGWIPYVKMPILKHYPYRTPDQAQRRRASAAARGFSGTPMPGGVSSAAAATGTSARPASPEAAIADAIGAYPTYAPEYLVARRFDGDFAELEMPRQGNLLTMMARWRRWTR